MAGELTGPNPVVLTARCVCVAKLPRNVDWWEVTLVTDLQKPFTLSSNGLVLRGESPKPFVPGRSYRITVEEA